MPDILTRLETAIGPDRSLDAAIAMAAMPEKYRESCWQNTAGGYVEEHRHGRGFRTAEAPRFTASLEAALMLVPAGWGWQVKHDRYDLRRRPRARLTCASDDGFEAEGDTAAMAVCIAAFRTTRLNWEGSR